MWQISVKANPPSISKQNSAGSRDLADKLLNLFLISSSGANHFTLIRLEQLHLKRSGSHKIPAISILFTLFCVLHNTYSEIRYSVVLVDWDISLLQPNKSEWMKWKILRLSACILYSRPDQLSPAIGCLLNYSHYSVQFEKIPHKYLFVFREPLIPHTISLTSPAYFDANPALCGHRNRLP